MQVAHLQKQGHYLTAKDNQVVAIHPSSVLDNKPAVSTLSAVRAVSQTPFVPPSVCWNVVTNWVYLSALLPLLHISYNVLLFPPVLLSPVLQWVLFQDFVLTSRNFVRSCTAVRVEWLVELAPHYFDLENWPEGETKGELERAYRRLQQEKDYAANKKK